MQPFFSVIIPVYNKEPHIARAIESVLSQNFIDFEIIIVCDPSTDKSNDVVQRYLNDGIKALYREEPGPGGYAARNLGITHARGRWIAFLDADDEWLPNHLDSLYSLHQAWPDSLVLVSGWEVLEADKSFQDSFTEQAFLLNTEINLSEYLTSELESRRPIWTSAVSIEKKLIMEAGMFPEGRISMGGDVDTWLRCVYMAGGLARSNTASAIYHRESVNMVTRSSYIVPDLHKVTTERLLSIAESPAMANLLKRRCNYMVMRSWFNNLHFDDRKNFSLGNYLYFDVQRIQCTLYVIFSRLPTFLAKLLHEFMRNFKLLRSKVRARGKSVPERS